MFQKTKQQTKIKDPEINKLKNKINKSRNILKNCKINQTTKINLNKEKHIQKQINKKCLVHKSSITEEQLKEIENSNYNQRMHKVIKQLNIKHKTPPSLYTNFQLFSYYKEKFNKSTTAIQQKQESQTHINVKIINSEVNSAIKSLKNNRSPGFGNITHHSK